jgi:hypothetical protein
MTESETEAETIDRLEVALRKIATAAEAARISAADAARISPADAAGISPAQAPKRPAAAEVDKDALKQSLDLLIARLRAGLTPANHAITHVITE